jgi:excisionase family DNA binding protein
MSIPEIPNRLSVGRLAVYTMLERGIIPAIRLGRRWIVTRHAFENWERTCGVAEKKIGYTHPRDAMDTCDLTPVEQ